MAESFGVFGEGTFDNAKFNSLDFSENVGVSDNVAVTFGPLQGTVTLSGSPVQDADVFAYNNTDGSFLGKTTTDSNGDYRFNLNYDNDEILVAVDYNDSGTRYGSEKSIKIN